MSYEDDQPTDAQIESAAEERWNQERACLTVLAGEGIDHE